MYAEFTTLTQWNSTILDTQCDTTLKNQNKTIIPMWATLT